MIQLLLQGLLLFMQYVTALNNFPPSLSKDSISE